MSDADAPPPVRVLVVADKLDRIESEVVAGAVERGLHVELMGHPGMAHFDDLARRLPRVTPFTFRGRFDRRAIRCVRERLREGRFDIVHAHPTKQVLGLTMIASAGLGVKRVGYRGTIGSLRRLNPSSLLSYYNPWLDRIICVCEGVRRYFLKARVPASKLVRIYKGHDLRWYEGVPKVDLTAEFGLPSGAMTVVCVANYRGLKGLHVLTRAVALLPPESRLHVLHVGAGGERVRDLAAADGVSDRVHQAGFRRDAVAITGSADVATMPSTKREGLNRAVIEAMAQSVPAVVSRLGGLMEVVEDGRQGFTVPPGDPHALAAALWRLEREPELRREMGRRARERISTAFRLEDSIELTARLYRDLAAGRVTPSPRP